MCRFVSAAVPVQVGGGFGQPRIETRCVEHGYMPVDLSVLTGTPENLLCPIGRIEQARDEAIAAIKAAMAQK
jgi:hypothetical protein